MSVPVAIAERVESNHGNARLDEPTRQQTIGGEGSLAIKVADAQWFFAEVEGVAVRGGRQKLTGFAAAIVEIAHGGRGFQRGSGAIDALA